MKNLYKTQMQWPTRGGYIHNLYAHDPEEGARRDEYGGSPFMTGLLLEAVIKYHQLTGSEIAADSIFRAVDWLINEGLVSSGDTFRYITADKYKDSDGEPDVNFLIVHAFGYAYRLSGYQNQEYFDIGQRILDRGVRDAFLGTRKHFNQNYRSSGHYLAYIWDGLQLAQGNKGTNPPRLKKKEIAGNFHMDFEWNINDSPTLSFAYQIPRAASVGMRVKTALGDWICVGGTATAQCADTNAKINYPLIDDGEWHELSADVKTAVQSVLPGIDRITSFEFSTSNEHFWLDEFKIHH